MTDGPDLVRLPDETFVGEEDRRVDVLTWSVIPALPGTRIEWEADWCKEGSIIVHAWLFRIDVVGRRDEYGIDTSCVSGSPMVLDAQGELVAARFADLDGKPGDVIEP